MVSLTMTYFHARVCTIIGAVSFHGPVRDGKGWFQDAMVVRLQLVPFFCAICAERQREEVWCWVVRLRTYFEFALYCKVIGSSLTGN